MVCAMMIPNENKVADYLERRFRVLSLSNQRPFQVVVLGEVKADKDLSFHYVEFPMKTYLGLFCAL